MKMKREKENEIRLKVSEALQDDAYKGIARIDPRVMKSLDLRRGDFISIKGEKITIALVDKSYPADVGEGIIRIDGILRRNAKTGIGEEVIVSKVDIKEAKKITIAPAQKGIMVQGDPEGLKRGLLGRALVKGDLVMMGGVQRRKDLMSSDFGEMNDIFGDILGGMGFGGMMGGGTTNIKFLVVNTNPNAPVLVTENTEVVLNSKAVDMIEESNFSINYEDIGGLKEEIRSVREMVELPLRHPEIFNKLGIEPPKGILLYGPPGTGKTLLAKAVASESEAHFIEFNTAQVNSAMHGQTEKNIEKIFDEAEKNAPSIIFIDELDSIAFKREDRGANEFLNTPVMSLLKHLDGLKDRKNVIVLGATNRLESIDEALRRPGRFDREFEIGVPGKEGRLQVLKIHTRNLPLAKDVDLKKIAGVTHGFVGADLAALAKEAAINVIRRVYPDINWKKDEPLEKEVLDKLEIGAKDFKQALKYVSPSAMREILIEAPNTKWEDVGGIEDVKTDLKEAVELPLKRPEVFSRLGIRPPKGLLLYGPPGTGKTLLAKAVATESEANFISIKGPEILSKWVGESAKAIKRIFAKARQVSPCIIFFDEIDAIASRRGGDDRGNGEYGNVINQLLVEMDGLEPLDNVTVIAATNRPDIMDPALLRPGRFDRILYVKVPDKASRKKILTIHSKGMPLEKINLNDLADKTEGYTGADLSSLLREAAMIALREDLKTNKVTKKHVEQALEKVPASVSKRQSERYQQIEKSYLRNAKASLPSENGGSYLG